MRGIFGNKAMSTFGRIVCRNDINTGLRILEYSENIKAADEPR